MAHLDSPGLPLSSASHDLFRGFSFVAPIVYNEANSTNSSSNSSVNTTLMSSSSSSNSVGNISQITASSSTFHSSDLSRNNNINLSTITITPSQSQHNMVSNHDKMMPPPAVPPMVAHQQHNNNNNNNNTAIKDINQAKRIQATCESLSRISLIKKDYFEDEYIIKEVFVFESLLFLLLSNFCLRT